MRTAQHKVLPRAVTIVEVGPRDGLQAEAIHVPTATKIELVDRLARAGLRRIEAASFVSPRWVPQMADGAAVMAGITRHTGTRYAALTPNMRGLETALASHADEVVIFGSASEAFSNRNINCSIAESIARFEPVARAAKDAGVRLRGSISCAFGCPYEGPVPAHAVVDMVRRFRDLGCDEIDLADTIGVGTAAAVQQIVDEASRAFRSIVSPDISTIPMARRWRTSSRHFRSGCRSFIRPSPVSADARMRKAQRATSQPRICCTSSKVSASKPASISLRWSRPGNSSAGRWVDRQVRAQHVLWQRVPLISRSLPPPDHESSGCQAHSTHGDQPSFVSRRSYPVAERRDGNACCLKQTMPRRPHGIEQLSHVGQHAPGQLRDVFTGDRLHVCRRELAS